jgi:cobalt/nickel transport system permease protein
MHSTPATPRRFRLGANPWQQLSPPGRVVCILSLVVAIVATPNGRWLSLGLYGFLVLLLLGLAQVPLFKLGQRLAVESSFASVLVLSTLFRQGEQILWQWGWLQVTDTGVFILTSVATKTSLALVLLNLLTLSTPIPELLQALAQLRLPPLLVAILASMYRYIGVLQAEFQAMSQAAQSRNLTQRSAWRRWAVGSMIGSLFLRTLDRGERIYQAMVSRGYQGLPSAPKGWPLTLLDGLALGFISLLIIFGQVV